MSEPIPEYGALAGVRSKERREPARTESGSKEGHVNSLGLRSNRGFVMGEKSPGCVQQGKPRAQEGFQAAHRDKQKSLEPGQ